MLKKICLLLIGVSVLCAGCIAVSANDSRLNIGSAENDFRCTVNRQNDLYVFTFNGQPENHNDLFAVNKEKLPVGMLEYAWIVYLENENKKVNFGLSFYKTMGQQKSYSIEDLLAHGQISLFVEKEGVQYSDLILGKRIKMKKEQEGIVIEFSTDEAGEFSITNYEFADFWILSAGDMPMKCRASLPKRG